MDRSTIREVEPTIGVPPASRALERIRRLLRSRAADHALLVEISPLLRELIPFDAAFWAAVDPLTLLATSPRRVENLPVGDICDRYWENEFFATDVNHFRVLARRRVPAVSLHRATEGRPDRSLRYRTINRSVGLGDELRCVLRTGGDVWGQVCLWRAHGARPFTATEVRLLAALSAPLGDAFRRAALLRPDPELDLPDVPGVLTFDGSGALESFTDTAERWLRELPRESPRDENHGLPIPGELRAVVNKARAVAAGRATGAARARLQVRGRWLMLHGFPLRQPNAPGGKIALVIEPVQGSDLAPLIVKAYQLGRREQQITRLVAHGLTTAEIAERLCLSTHTVRDYLKQVFEKVEVSTRGGLVAKIFAQQYRKPLTSPDIPADS